jgi:hypothetical protein
MKLPSMRKILTDYYVEKALKNLVNEAGVSRELLEVFLRSIPVLSDEMIPFAPWTDPRRIEGLVTQLRDIAAKVQTLNESMFLIPVAIESSRRTAKKRAAFVGGPLDWPRAMKGRQPQLPQQFLELPRQMGLYANTLARLQEWHQILFPHGISQRGMALFDLVLLVEASKNKIKTRWKDLATLLGAAFQATGASSSISADWLRTFHTRTIRKIRSFEAAKKTK